MQHGFIFVNFFLTFWPHHMTCGIYSGPGSNAHLLEWNHRVLTNGPPEKSLINL